MTRIKITRREVLATDSNCRFTEYSVWIGRRIASRQPTYQRALAAAVGLASR